MKENKGDKSSGFHIILCKWWKASLQTEKREYSVVDFARLLGSYSLL